MKTSSQTQLPLIVVRHHQVVHGGVTVVPDALQEVLLALTARGSVHTVRGSDLVGLGAVARFAALGALGALAAGTLAAGGRDVSGVAGTPQFQ